MADGAKQKLLIRTLKGERGERPPFWYMRQAGRYLPEYRELRARMGGFWDLVFSPEQAAAATLQPLERFGMDAAILFSDILVIPHALGQEVSFHPKVGPVMGPLDLAAPNLGLSRDHTAERLALIFETIRIVKTKLPEDKALIGFAGSPWTVITYMVEGKGRPEKEETRTFWREDRQRFERLIDEVVEATVVYLEHQIEAGAEALQLFDSWAGALQGDEFEALCIAPTRRITSALKKRHPGVPLIGYPKGVGRRTKAYFEDSGVDAVSIDWQTDPVWAANELQPLGCVQGNLEPALLAGGGEAMLKAAEHILRTFANGPHVFNLGHGITPDVPPENVAELSAFLRGWRREGSKAAQ